MQGKLKRLMTYVLKVPLYASMIIFYATIFPKSLLEELCKAIIYQTKSSSESKQDILYSSQQSLFSCVLFTMISFSYGIFSKYFLFWISICSIDSYLKKISIYLQFVRCGLYKENQYYNDTYILYFMQFKLNGNDLFVSLKKSHLNMSIKTALTTWYWKHLIFDDTWCINYLLKVHVKNDNNCVVTISGFSLDGYSIYISSLLKLCYFFWTTKIR